MKKSILSLFLGCVLWTGCQAKGFDIGVESVINYVTPRPAAQIILNTTAGDMSALHGAHCASGIGGQVQLTFSGPVAYIGPATGALTPTSVTGNTVTWAIADFGPVDPYTAFNLNFAIDTYALAGTNVCIHVAVTPTGGDFNPSNNNYNYCFTVVDALDPNHKTVYPTIIDTPGELLTYDIVFQNTGTTSATNVRVTDTLSRYLDPTTFHLIAYSANTTTQVIGNVVIFNIPNIHLPDSASNPVGSIGYVQYSIKTRDTITPGIVVNNSASVYFDLNPAVFTDTTHTPYTICHSTYDTITQTVCQGTVISLAGNFYGSTGVYTDTLFNAGGCDSVVTLYLTVNAVTYDSLTPNICTGDTFYINGHGYYRYGTYLDTLLNAAGCDSIVTTVLIVAQISYDTLSQAICAGDSIHFGSGVFKQAGVYNDTIFNGGGCPVSVTTLLLTVNALPVVTFNYTQDTALVNLGFPDSGTYSCLGNGTYTAPLSGGSPAGGAFSGPDVSNNILTISNIDYSPSKSAFAFAYTYVDSNGCSASVNDTLFAAICLGITTINPNTLFTLYPNPAGDYVMIDFDGSYIGATIFVKDITGRQLFETQLTASPQQITTTGLPAGVYLVTVFANGDPDSYREVTRLLVKE